VKFNHIITPNSLYYHSPKSTEYFTPNYSVKRGKLLSETTQTSEHFLYHLSGVKISSLFNKSLLTKQQNLLTES